MPRLKIICHHQHNVITLLAPLPLARRRLHTCRSLAVGQISKSLVLVGPVSWCLVILHVDREMGNRYLKACFLRSWVAS